MSIRERSDKSSSIAAISAPYLPDVTGLSNVEAAEEYAKAGLKITPVCPGTKHPGSYIGNGWQKRATDDLDSICEWWKRWPDAGIAIHVGTSGFFVLDVDNPDNVPEWLWTYLDGAIFRPTTNDPNSRRGHYFFSLTEGQRFGSGLGKLKQSKGQKWGEVRCYGGGLILGPTVHPRANEGGHYSTAPGGNPISVPAEIAEKLSEAPDPETYRLLTPGELKENAKQFLAAYSYEKEPWALAPILGNFDPTPNNRHASMWETLCWAMREAKAGRFSAQRALDELNALWNKSFGIPDD